MAFSKGLFAREAIVDAARGRINVIGNRDTFQRAELTQRKSFNLFFHHDFLSSFKPPTIKQKPCQARLPPHGHIRESCGVIELVGRARRARRNWVAIDMRLACFRRARRARPTEMRNV